MEFEPENSRFRGSFASRVRRPSVQKFETIFVYI